MLISLNWKRRAYATIVYKSCADCCKILFKRFPKGNVPRSTEYFFENFEKFTVDKQFFCKLIFKMLSFFKLQQNKKREKNGRSDRIRTYDPCVPNAVLYRAELHSDKLNCGEIPQKSAILTGHFCIVKHLKHFQWHLWLFALLVGQFFGCKTKRWCC